MLNDLGSVINKPFSDECYRLQTSHVHLACRNEVEKEVLTRGVFIPAKGNGSAWTTSVPNFQSKEIYLLKSS